MRADASSALAVVVLNNHCHAQGGASRVAIDEAIGLANRGAKVTFIGAVGPISTELSGAPMRVVCLGQKGLAEAGGSPESVLAGLWNRKAFKALDAILAELNPRNTIVHLHAFPQALSTSPVRCALDRGFKVVCTLHDFFTVCPNGAFFDYVAKEPCSRDPLSLSCITTNCDKRHYTHKLYRVARSAIQNRFGYLPRKVVNYIALSRRSRDVLKPYLPHDAVIRPLGNPIDVEKASPVDVAKNGSIVAVGRLDPEKGVEVLLQASRQAGMRVVFIGDGSMRRFAEDSGVCRVTGWLSKEAVLAELQAARCLVFPSLWYETYGLAVAEAAALGIPAIVSHISAAAERVTDGVTGWHARSGDVDDLTRCLHITRSDDAIRAAGLAAYTAFWKDPSTLESHVAELLDYYAEILGSPEGSMIREG